MWPTVKFSPGEEKKAWIYVRKSPEMDTNTRVNDLSRGKKRKKKKKEKVVRCVFVHFVYRYVCWYSL